MCGLVAGWGKAHSAGRQLPGRDAGTGTQGWGRTGRRTLFLRVVSLNVVGVFPLILWPKLVCVITSYSPLELSQNLFSALLYCWHIWEYHGTCTVYSYLHDNLSFNMPVRHSVSDDSSLLTISFEDILWAVRTQWPSPVSCVTRCTTV